MAQQVASLYADIGAKTDGFEKGAASVRSGLLSLAKNYITTGAVIATFGEAIRFSIKEAADGEREQAALNAVIASTGGIAGMTAEELNKMALSLSRVSTFSDGAINESQALLLTFTKIGEDVFPRAQQSILDVATLMGGDLKSATIQVGKALNDPIAGLSALSRVGIQFSEDQKNTIKVFMEMGDVAAAQGIILDELSTQFGGQAAAAANTYQGELQQLRNEVEILGGTIGDELLPSVREFSGTAKESIKWVVENYEAIKKWGDTALKVLNIGYLLSDVFTNGIEANKSYASSVEENRDVLEEFYGKRRRYTPEEVIFAKAVKDARLELSSQSDVVETELIPSYEDLEKELLKIEQAQQKLRASIVDGAIDITNSQREFQDEQQDILDKITETRAEGEKLYPWEHEKIEENKKALEDLGNQYFENQEKFRDAQTERLAMMAIEKIALSDGVEGYSQAEYERAQAILMTQDVATAAAFEEMQAMENLTSAVADGRISVEDYARIWQEAAADGVIAVDEISAAIAAVPTEHTTTFNIVTVGAPPNLSLSNEPAPVGTHRRASGGNVNAGESYLVGEQGMEIFTPNQNGMITPNSRTGSRMGTFGTGATINIMLDSATPDPDRVAYNLKPAVERVVRQLQQEGKLQ